MAPFPPDTYTKPEKSQVPSQLANMNEFVTPSDSGAPFDAHNDGLINEEHPDVQDLFNPAYTTDARVETYMQSLISDLSPPRIDALSPHPHKFTQPSGTMSIEKYHSLQPRVQCTDALASDQAYLNSFERELRDYLYKELGHCFYEALGPDGKATMRPKMKKTTRGLMIAIPVKKATTKEWILLAQGIVKEVMRDSFPYGLRKDVGIRFVPGNWETGKLA